MSVIMEEQAPLMDAGDNAPEQPVQEPVTRPVVKPMPFCRAVSIKELIRQWNPTGWRVNVNLPFIGDDRAYMFYIRPQPEIAWLPSINALGMPGMGTYWYYHSPLLLDVIPALNNADYTVAINIPTGTGGQPAVTLNQHSPPPLLAEITRMYRKWRGSLKFRLRVVSNFATQGYVFTTFIRRAYQYKNTHQFFSQHMPVARYDETYNQGMQNCYLVSDLSMFRHINMIAPYEYIADWKDRAETLELFSDADLFTTTCISDLDNLIGVGIRGQIASESTANAISFELEYAAGDDFELAMPMPPAAGTFLNQTGLITGGTASVEQTIAVSGVTIPSTRYEVSTSGIVTFPST